MNGNGGWLIYDGDCGFCTASAAWIARRWPVQSGARAIPWQLAYPQVIEDSQLALEDLQRAAWWIEGGLREEGSRAVGRALVEAGGPLSLLGRSLLVAPLSWVAPLGYRLIARYRYRLPGATPACKS